MAVKRRHTLAIRLSTRWLTGELADFAFGKECIEEDFDDLLVFVWEFLEIHLRGGPIGCVLDSLSSNGAKEIHRA